MKKPLKTPEDSHLWKRVSRTVSPLRKNSSRPQRSEFSALLRVTDAAKDAKPNSSAPPAQNQTKQTRRGKVSIDARLDLHDMTQQQAFDALRRKLIRSFNQNHKCILVITGKGVRGQGILRRNLPLWLEHADIRPIIAEFAPAHLRHGGGGAWYIFLKGGPDRRLP